MLTTLLLTSTFLYHSALGKGAFGEVYEGLLAESNEDSLTGRVAVKVRLIDLFILQDMRTFEFNMKLVWFSDAAISLYGAGGNGFLDGGAHHEQVLARERRWFHRSLFRSTSALHHP